MIRHEATLEGVQRAPDGTVTAFRLHELLEDDRPALGPGSGRTEADRRAPAVVGVVAVFCTGVAASIIVVALAVLP